MGECGVVLFFYKPSTDFVTESIVKPFSTEGWNLEFTDWRSLRQGNDSTQSPYYYV